MLRFKFYVGVFPVAGLLILVCLYSIYNHSKLSRQLDVLQEEHYGPISLVESALLATSQLERAILLEADGQADLARRAYERSIPAFSVWFESGRGEGMRASFRRSCASYRLGARQSSSPENFRKQLR